MHTLLLSAALASALSWGAGTPATTTIAATTTTAAVAAVPAGAVPARHDDDDHHGSGHRSRYVGYGHDSAPLSSWYYSGYKSHDLHHAKNALKYLHKHYGEDYDFGPVQAPLYGSRPRPIPPGIHLP